MIIKNNIIVKKENNWYLAKCIDNNITSQGRTIKESLENLEEAIELYYE